MKSPILDVFPGSPWRAHVKEVWRYLKRCYKVTGDERCGTHIHISLIPNYSLAELKQLASSVVYFEPAFLALVPEHRRSCTYAVSNWLISPQLGRLGRSRHQSMKDISNAPDEVELFGLIQGYINSHFSWNFLNFFTSKGTVEFRLPPASLTAEATLGWAELALNFVQAATQHGSSIGRYAANVGGLRSFLRRVNVRGLNEPAWLRQLWENKQGYEALKPLPIVGFTHTKLTADTAEQMRQRLRENRGLA